MNLVTSLKIKKSLKNISKFYILGFIFIILTIPCIWWAYNIKNQDISTVTMNSAIIESKTNAYAQLEVASIPYAFAEYDDTTNKYYLVFDKENLMYIIYLSNTDFNKLNKEDIEENPITITGMTESIPEDVKKIAIEVCNEEAGNERFTEENFENYVGTIYLDTTKKPTSIFMQILLTTIFLIISIILFIHAYKIKKKSMDKIQSFNNKEWNKIESELENPTCIGYDKYKLYFTENYVVNLKSGVDIFAYTDILWIYLHIIKQYGITTNQNIILITKNKEKHKIYFSNILSKKVKKLYNDVLEFLSDKNPKITVGYTQENIQKMKNLYEIK